jgi:hypothetical protein
MMTGGNPSCSKLSSTGSGSRQCTSTVNTLYNADIGESGFVSSGFIPKEQMLYAGICERCT